MGDRSYGLDPNYVARVADEVKGVMKLGAQVCLVVGGGNIFRGVSGRCRGHGTRDRRSDGHVGHRH